MNIIKSFFMFFNYLNDLHVILASLPFLWMNRKDINVQRIFISLLYSFALLVLVKGSFRIPHPQYTHTFAFPSGHCWMMLATSYFVFKSLLKEKKQYLFWTSFFVFIEAGVCICGGYHTFFDCVGGIIFSSVSVIMIECLYKKVKSIKINAVLCSVFAICVYYIIWQLAPNYANRSLGTMFLYMFIIVIMNFVLHRK